LDKSDALNETSIEPLLLVNFTTLGTGLSRSIATADVVTTGDDVATLSTGTTINNLGIDSNGNVVSSDLTDVRLTGGTYSNGTSVFTNNTGGTFSVTGFSTGTTDTYVTGVTWSSTNNVLTTSLNDDTDLFTDINIVSGLTVTSGVTYSSDTYNYKYSNENVFGLYNSSVLRRLENNDTNFVIGAGGSSNNDVRLIFQEGTENFGMFLTYKGNNNDLSLYGYNGGISGPHFQIDRDGTYFNINTPLTINDDLTVTGTSRSDNYTGATGAAVYYGDGSNLTGISTQDTVITGGTYSNGTSVFTNNTGGTFSVSGFSTPFTGGTVTGSTIFTNGLTADTIFSPIVSLSSALK
jgi:hypothetical protein